MAHVYCWNHVLQDIRRWLKDRGASIEDIGIYTEHVRQLLHQSSQEAYTTLLAKYQLVWDQSFAEYYSSNIHKVVAGHLGRWKLEKLHIYYPYSGITTNKFEALKRVLKDLHQWKQVPLDVMILLLFQLQAY